MKNKILSLLLVALVGFNLSCKEQAMTSSGPSATGEPNTPDILNAEKIIEKAELDAQVEGGLFGGFQSIVIDKVNKAVNVRVPFPMALGIGGIQYPIEGIDGAYYELINNCSSKVMSCLQMHIPLKFLAQADWDGTADRLPNGDKLPAYPDGEPPAIMSPATYHGKEFWMYLGPRMLGIYVPIKDFNPYLQLVFPIKNKSKTKILGYLATIPKKITYDGGIYVTMALPEDIARILKDIL